MNLAPGTRLGAYEVVSLLGAEGMGGVYRARDHRLNRQLALKVLPDTVASDRARLASAPPQPSLEIVYNWSGE